MLTAQISPPVPNTLHSLSTIDSVTHQGLCSIHMLITASQTCRFGQTEQKQPEH